MNIIYSDIQSSILKDEKLLGVLIDPDKMEVENVQRFIEKINTSPATHIFVGGSSVGENATDTLVARIKKFSKIPVILFPGDVAQITGKADAILFLSLLSGRNAEYLIGKHVKAVSKLAKTNLEVIPTGYILIENGKETAIETVTGTAPLPRNNIQMIVETAKAGELLGMKMIYLEAGSGAIHPISEDIIIKVKSQLNIPLIVGGGIRSKEQLVNAYKSGADLVVIGNAFEEDESFFDQIKSPLPCGHFPKGEN